MESPPNQIPMSFFSFENDEKVSWLLINASEPVAVMNLSIDGSLFLGLSANPAKKKSEPIAICGSALPSGA